MPARTSHVLQAPRSSCTHLQVRLARRLLGQQVSMQVVVLHVQVSGATQASIASHNNVRGQAAQGLSHILHENKRQE